MMLGATVLRAISARSLSAYAPSFQKVDAFDGIFRHGLSSAESSTSSSSGGVNLIAHPDGTTSGEFVRAPLQVHEAANVVSATAHVAPHPSKLAKGGEDAFFIASDGRTLGVADGVGGWSEVGVDPSLYSRALMQRTLAACEQNPRVSLTRALGSAYRHTLAEEIRGSSTACLVRISDGTLTSLNIGDSGFLLVRDGEVVMRSEEQLHAFNFPFQLGIGCDSPKDASHSSTDVMRGDLIVVASDGLFDNLFEHEILDILEQQPDDLISSQLVCAACEAATSVARETPFAQRLAELDHIWDGGKVDDTTVVVARIG